MTGTPAGVGEFKANDKLTVTMTYPGLEGEVVEELDWECEQRNGGYEFKGK
jgi:acylpyruvate hydrolase